MSLGELTQAAAAFVTVQGAFNWLVDNFQRLADLAVFGTSCRHSSHCPRRDRSEGDVSERLVSTRCGWPHM